MDCTIDNIKELVFILLGMILTLLLYNICIFWDANWCMRDITDKSKIYFTNKKRDKANVAIVDNYWIWTMNTRGSLCYSIFVYVWNFVKKIFLTKTVF